MDYKKTTKPSFMVAINQQKVLKSEKLSNLDVKGITSLVNHAFINSLNLEGARIAINTTEEGVAEISIYSKLFEPKKRLVFDRELCEKLTRVSEATFEPSSELLSSEATFEPSSELLSSEATFEPSSELLSHVWTILDNIDGLRELTLYGSAIYELYGDKEGEDKLPLLTGQIALSASYRPDEGKTIIGAYDGYGTETIERMDTLDQYRIILDKEIEHFKDNPKRLARAKKEREKLDVLINTRKSIGQQTTWVKSGDFRDLCRKTDYETACESFPRGAPVNLRTQEMVDKEYSVLGRLGRLGVITDVTNGWYSIEDLEAMLSEHELFLKKAEEIEDFINNPKPTSLFGKLKQKLFGIKPKLNPDQIQSADQASSLLREAYETSGAKAREMIEDRKETLERQMLQYLMEQIRANPENVKDGQFDLLHLSVLNLKKQNLDKSGWRHDEGVAFRDFRNIMKHFNGKEIIFSDDGPYVDGDKIFLPRELIDTAEPIQLNTYIFNVCPQGNLKNDGLQKEHNDKELHRLLLSKHGTKFTIHDNQKIWNDLINGTSSGYDLAERFGLLLHDMAKDSGAFGINCASGKDRTGFVAARTMQNKLTKIWPENPYGRKILDKDSTATRVVRDNVLLQKVLKINPINALLHGISGISKWKFLSETLPAQLSGEMAT